MGKIQFKMKSDIGPVYLVASDKGLQGIFWKHQEVPMVAHMNIKRASPEIKNLMQAVREISEYFDGKRKNFDICLDIEGTEFQKKVWKELRKIPYGKTLSYKEVARKIGTKAIRAVGSANGKNPLPIVVPCHRVIASDGGIGGYTGGLKIKQSLLDLEQRSF